MATLNNNEINDALDAELGKEDVKSRITRMKERSEEDNSASGEEFSVDKYDYNFRVIKDAEDLKEGTSYSEHMLDLNELMEKGVLHRGNKIDLSEMPEIETIQAATQEQLDMLTPKSKKQITAIHLSNNTPVGWNDDYDYDNKYEMDNKLDMSSYKNVTEVQTHFYVNNDLEDIVMPEMVQTMMCRHSKMKNLQKDGGLKDVNVFLDRAETAFDYDDGSVDEIEQERDDVSYNAFCEYIDPNDATTKEKFEEWNYLSPREKLLKLAEKGCFNPNVYHEMIRVYNVDLNKSMDGMNVTDRDIGEKSLGEHLLDAFQKHYDEAKSNISNILKCAERFGVGYLDLHVDNMENKNIYDEPIKAGSEKHKEIQEKLENWERIKEIGADYVGADYKKSNKDRMEKEIAVYEKSREGRKPTTLDAVVSAKIKSKKQHI